LKLISVYDLPFMQTCKVLYDLLTERTPEQSISHKKMPTFAEHSHFVMNQPYPEWYMIDDGGYVGSIYLTKANEIGISVFNKFQGRGYGKRAVRMLVDKHKGKRLLANINPLNERSIKFFTELGFKHIQQTYELS
jgi:RimJ/RimL family protein N-acetyltransferase